MYASAACMLLLYNFNSAIYNNNEVLHNSRTEKKNFWKVINSNSQPVVPSDFCLCASIHAVKRYAFEKVSFIYAEFRNQTQSGTFSKIKVKIMKL